MKKIKSILVLLLGIFPALMHAHHPNEVHYDFQVNANASTLKIHLTPITLVDLVQYLYPELKDIETIKLENYVNDFETYFNNTIKLKTENKTFQYKLVSYNLYDHDASLNFRVLNEISLSKIYSIEIDAFCSVYKSIRNTVRLNIHGVERKYQLNRSKRQTEVSFLTVQKSETSYVVLMFLVCVFLLFIWKSKNATFLEQL